jgi:hypothetical protein
MTCILRRIVCASARARILGLLALVGFALLTVGDSKEKRVRAEPLAMKAVDPDPVPAGEQPLATNVVRQGFPAAKADSSDLTKSDTAWEIEWELTHPLNRPLYPPGSVLRIRNAKFMWKDRYGKPQWVVVARMLELAEIYVPYDNGWMAFLDIHDMPFHITPARQEFLGPNCVLPGEILKSPNPYWSGTVHKEVHDDGIRWMSAETDVRYEIADRARRGEKLILWSTYYGANYRYLIEYSFGDDGMLTCRVGPTGRNIFNRQDDQGDTHLHIGCWRMELDLGDSSTGLGGPKDNDVFLVRRIFNEATERFAQVAKPFAKNSEGQACEGSARWNAEEFTSLRVQSRVRKNVHGRPVAFDLIPHRLGAPRQLQPEGGSYAANLDFINQDFWVTRAESGFTNYIDVPQYASQRRPLEGHPVTIWHCTPALHFPRGEDFGSEDGKNCYTGVAMTFWTGFYLKPRDLFDSSPLYLSRPRQPRVIRENP